MRGSGFSAAEAGWLASGAQASAYTEVEWRLDGGAFRADIPVAASQFEDGEIDLVYQVNPRTPWRASVVLRIRRVPLARVCVNRAHREDGVLIPPGSHVHIRRSSDHPEVYAEIDDPAFPTVSVGEAVQHGQHLAVLKYLAARFNISLAGLTWTDPPEEVTR
jgi:hypothetical protein